MNVLDARTQSHQLRKSQDYEVVIDGQGTNLAAPEPVQGQAFYPGGDAPKKEYSGTTMERTTEALGDLAQTTGSMGVGAVSGGLGFFGDVGSLIGGLASALFPGDQNRIEAATETMTKISETIGSERFLGMYRDFINNQADLSQEDKKMMLDAAEVGSFMSIPGAGVALAKGKDVIKEGVVKAGQAADARIAERAADTGVTLTAGADPMPAVDAAISAAGRAARRDPNDSAGDAMAQAQARYFETGNYEPPTAENPVSIVKPTEDKPGIIAFHGSGADFDEFRLEMIGTGEGAQAYGYGLYFTDSEDIAKFYRDATGGANVLKTAQNIKIKAPSGGTETAANFTGFRNKFAEFYGEDAALFADRYLGQFTIDPDAPQDVLIERAKVLMANVKESDRIPQNAEEIVSKIALPERGKIYKVGLAPKPDELLDYDLPLSQQPKMLKLIDDVHGDPEIIIQQAGLDPATATGGDFVKALGGIGQEQGAKAASEFLAKAGIPGIKFFSGNTRNTAGGKLIDVAETTDGFRAKVAVDNRAGGLGGSGRVVTTSQPYKTKQQALDWADEAIKNKESNYVIFDDKAVKILEKYGIVGPVAVTAASVSQTNTEAADGQDT